MTDLISLADARLLADRQREYRNAAHGYRQIALARLRAVNHEILKREVWAREPRHPAPHPSVHPKARDRVDI